MSSNNTRHVVIGAGPLGTNIARQLAGDGHAVRIVTRSGTGIALAGVERIAADVRDSVSASKALSGASVVYNCANPLYTEWAEVWPTLQGSPMRAAAENDAVYVAAENLYMYGPSPTPIGEKHPYDSPSRKGQVRAKHHLELIAAHNRGDVRAVAGRASDFIGPEVLDAALGERVVPKLLANKKVQTLGDPDIAHTFTAIADFATLLITLGRTESAWGRAWHAPSAPAISPRALLERMAAIAGLPSVKVTAIPGWALKTLGTVVPIMRELVEMQYQWTSPYLIDSSSATRELGLTATDLETTLRETIDWYRARDAKAA